ncbi:MAG: ribonuclease HII [Gammaproteobacteria bacterium]
MGSHDAEWTRRLGAMTGLIAGVDEAGRGPLAGPVVAAAVILDPAQPIAGLADSKTLSARRREALAAQIRAQASGWSVVFVDAAEIDACNILEATLRAMTRAVAALAPAPDRVLVDGNRLPKLPMPAEAIVRGDARVPAISAASILAKVARDAWMTTAALAFPGYGFEIHKGYPTRAHRDALARLGVTPLHRRSFAPVAAVLHTRTGDTADQGQRT